MNMLRKIENDFKDGKITIEEFKSLIEDLRNKKIENDFKTNNKAIKTVKTVNKIKYINHPIDNTYLFDLLSNINFNVNNDYIIGLKNLLYDNNMIYNHIGVKINIVKFLLNIDLKDLKVFKVDNNNLNDSFKFLVYKNGKIKNYTKIYIKNDLIIMNTLLHDNISSVILSNKSQKDINDIIYDDNNNNDIITYKDNNDINTIKYSYTYVDNEYKVLSYIKDLINVLKNFKKEYKKLTISIEDINKDNQYKYLQIINKNYSIYYRYEKLYNKYEYILKQLKEEDIFKSNDLNYETSIKDYDLYNLNHKDFKDIKIIVRSFKPYNYYYSYLQHLKRLF